MLINKRNLLLLFGLVIIIWGLNWTVTKVLVQTIPPLWTSCYRMLIASAALLALQGFTHKLHIPARRDWRVIAAISLFHMTICSALMALGLVYAPVGRSVVLGYTTPLWITPLAWLLLKEPQPPRRILGVFLGVGGILVLFNPASLDLNDHDALLGSALILLSAFTWSFSILSVRAHTWIASPYALLFWQTLPAGLLLAVLALILEGPPRLAFSALEAGLLIYNGLLGTALAFWAITMINASLPAVTTALGILLTPVVGISSSMLFLGESLDWPLWVAAFMIILGIGLGVSGRVNAS